MILSLLTLCLGATAQDTQLTSVSVTGQRSSLPVSRQPSEATTIVQNFFGGLNTPSPVIPPLVDEITNEFKKEEPGWQVTPVPVDRSMKVEGQKSPLPVSRQPSEATTIVQNFFGELNTPSPVIPPLVDEITNEFKKEESGWQVPPHPVDRSMKAATTTQTQEAAFASSPQRDLSRKTVMELESNDLQEPQVVKTAPSEELTQDSFASSGPRSLKKPVATPQKPANGFAIFKGDADSEKPKRAKQPLFKNWFTKKSKEISVEK